MPLSPGDKLGLYEIISAIGVGGMGEVYKTRDTRLGRFVVIANWASSFPPKTAFSGKLINRGC